MLSLTIGVLTRIFSNSYLNVFQKILTNKGEHPSIINFYTYLGLTLISILICPTPIFTQEIISNFLIMGLLGGLGNYFIIKALSCGELSTLAPINSYKPIIALILGFFLLNELPQATDLIGIFLIIIGTLLLGKNKILLNKASFYRTLALIFSGTEALFIKKIIILTDIPSSFFYWAFASLIFTYIFAISSKHKIKIKPNNIKTQLCLILLVTLMQYSTNYVFAKMNVSNALALFQLSTIVSVLLGVNIFKESNLINKLIASVIMIIGAIIIIIC